MTQSFIQNKRKNVLTEREESLLLTLQSLLAAALWYENSFLTNLIIRKWNKADISLSLSLLHSPLSKYKTCSPKLSESIWFLIKQWEIWAVITLQSNLQHSPELQIRNIKIGVLDESVVFPPVSYSPASSLIELYICWQGAPAPL